ncbi:hypothetical protein V8C43DRAFT_229186 [Trichoderma afarasin]
MLHPICFLLSSHSSISIFISRDTAPPNLTRENNNQHQRLETPRPSRDLLPLQPHFARPIHVLDLRPCRELALDLQGTSCSNSIASSFGLSLAETRCIVPIVVSLSHPAFETASLAAALPSAIAVLLPIALSALSNTCTHPYYIPPRSCALLQSRGCSRHTRSGSAALISPSRIFFFFAHGRDHFHCGIPGLIFGGHKAGALFPELPVSTQSHELLPRRHPQSSVKAPPSWPVFLGSRLRQPKRTLQGVSGPLSLPTSVDDSILPKIGWDCCYSSF